MHVLFYTKPGCSLCDEAEQMMELIKEDYPLTWTAVNIEENDAKHEQYVFMIPVVEKDNKVLCSGVISYVDLALLFESDV
ncbi:glutaredoxin family protein [Sporosarcina aquimarina]|uniref:Glutaredoxin family protein n=1 Tax=Sporosarcina aquimarina TaxID=114975 RepID=A0ABU4G239_9BACL|nr:glutaredoxin family protein [Sporosarcina aquimarina]MDW0111018.1 glutaredoxin family protein [Sporosarcina aquimarina]